MNELQQAKDYWGPILERQTIFSREEIDKGLEDFFNNQPERLSEKTYFKNEDGIYLYPVIGSDSLNQANI